MVFVTLSGCSSAMVPRRTPPTGAIVLPRAESTTACGFLPGTQGQDLRESPQGGRCAGAEQNLMQLLTEMDFFGEEKTPARKDLFGSKFFI